MTSVGGVAGVGLVRVVIADDDAQVRDGLRTILGGAADIAVVGEAVDGHDAVDVVARLVPHVVLMDLRMPRLDGIAAARRLRERGVASRVLVLTTFDADELVVAALRHGAAGFLLKDTPPADLVDAIRRVAAGQPMLSPSVTTRLIAAVVRPDAAGAGLTAGDGDFTSTGGRRGAGVPNSSNPGTGSRGDDGGTPDARARRARVLLAGLTEREREVAIAVGRGLTNAEIAAALRVGVATVKTHVGSLLGKLQAANRVQIARCVHDAGLE